MKPLVDCPYLFLELDKATIYIFVFSHPPKSNKAMRYISAVVTLIILSALIIFMDRSWGRLPALGRLLSPWNGYMNDPGLFRQDSFQTFSLKELNAEVKVYFDDRMVPHIFATTDHDAYYMQGYIHARDRLWQMEFQTMFAGGRLSEIVGSKALPLDKSHRRLGLASGARLAESEILKDSATSLACRAYTEGINSYISTLTQDQYPFEYKLMGYKPELWSIEKTALLLKFMAKDLAGYDEDFEKSYVLATLGWETYNLMYPIREDSLSPIIPASSVKQGRSLTLNDPTNTDSTYFHPQLPAEFIGDKPDKDNGSNNWAIAGEKSKTGKPILCNDPHLKLGLPSLWYEVQITTPQYSSYGVSLPGAPGIIIGFNQNIAFGFTNAMRDVMDYYRIEFKDQSRKEYKYNDKWLQTTMRIDTYRVKNEATVYDTVLMTHFGPVIYDRNFHGLRNGLTRVAKDENYAVTWAGNLPSNELITFLKLNRSKTYDDYMEAIKTFSCPGQNMIFASKSGDIAITQQGLFPAKWPYQGEFVMEGKDSLYEWQGFIPNENLLTMKNPERGFVSSANQLPVDPNIYPYFLGGDYITERGYRINQVLNQKKKFDITDMMALQNDNFNTSAHQLLPIIFSRADSLHLGSEEGRLFNVLRKWDLLNDANSEGALVFEMMLDTLEYLIWHDELKKSYLGLMPERNTLVQNLIKNINFKCVDNIYTPVKETFDYQLAECFRRISPAIASLKKDNITTWGIYKHTNIPHLLDIKQNMPSLSRLGLNVGGGEGIVNAIKRSHGPSWRMIISLTDTIEAYGVYPGGQSGHPGNQFYDTGITPWSEGKYFTLWLMNLNETDDKRIIQRWIITP
ncbi:MAG TPA: penicillin acylase family protein [Saprospiraceae bacterium]|nr:penicillin acylase family protein [Saprospiraceae bacterium]